MGTMMRTLVAALTACLVCLTLVGCGSNSSSGGGGSSKVEKREVRKEARAAPGSGGSMMTREDAEGSDDSPDE